MHWVLDVILIAVLVAYLVNGARRGFAHVLGSMLGVIAGAVAAMFVLPLIGGMIESSFWRLVATVAVAVALVVVGHALGATVGDAIARRVSRQGARRTIDRVLGAVLSLVTAALVLSIVASSITPLGVPLLSRAVGDSVVLSTIERITPTPVQQFLARARANAVRDTIPSIVGALGGGVAGPAPDVDTSTSALDHAARSVVRITGNAYQCGQSQSGTGFVVASDRVVTNAHVVSGVTEPVVETSTGTALEGRIVYFDPEHDLAVLAVPGLGARTLPMGDDLAAGDVGVWDGYPYGGPFATGGARIQHVGEERVDDIYGTTATTRDIYTMSADIEPGDSGGPLLSTRGDLVGIVFAKSATTDGVGFAMTLDELEPVIEKASGLTKRVASGHCVRD